MSEPSGEAEPLGVDDVVPYLAARGLVDAAVVVDGGLRVTSALRRNRNLRLELGDGRGFLVKQAEPGEPGAAASLDDEATFYTLARREPRVAPVAAFVPRLRLYDPERALLALELVAGRSLWQELAAPASPASAADPLRALGEALGVLHLTFRDLLDHPSLTSWTRGRPFPARLHRPPLSLRSRLSTAQRRLFRILGSPGGLGEEVAAIPWRVETAVHGDLRSDNVLVTPANGTVGIRLVDWEFVQWGDPAWDVAAVLADLLLLWIRGMPLAPQLDAETRVRRSRHPLSRLRPLFGAFWDAYAGTVPGTDGDLLRRAVRWSAVHLVQAAYEEAWGRHALPARAVLMLQVSANVFADPARAAVDLYGLSPAAVP